jgi:hypothetical protein
MTHLGQGGLTMHDVWPSIFLEGRCPPNPIASLPPPAARRHFTSPIATFRRDITTVSHGCRRKYHLFSFVCVAGRRATTIFSLLFCVPLSVVLTGCPGTDGIDYSRPKKLLVE